MLTAAACIVWLLTATCADDALHWNPPGPGISTRIVYDGQDLVVPAGLNWVLIGCWEGTIRVSHISDSGAESEPAFVSWAADPGRQMEIDCAVGRCRQYKGRRRNPERKHLCEVVP